MTRVCLLSLLFETAARTRSATTGWSSRPSLQLLAVEAPFFPPKMSLERRCIFGQARINNGKKGDATRVVAFAPARHRMDLRPEVLSVCACDIKASRPMPQCSGWHLCLSCAVKPWDDGSDIMYRLSIMPFVSKEEFFCVLPTRELH
jgi:hypothetical protein